MASLAVMKTTASFFMTFQGLNSALPKNPRQVNNPFGTTPYMGPRRKVVISVNCLRVVMQSRSLAFNAQAPLVVKVGRSSDAEHYKSIEVQNICR